MGEHTPHEPHRHDSAPEPRWCSCAIPDEALEERRSSVSRRGFITGVSAASALAAAGWVANPGAAQAADGSPAKPGMSDKSVTITVMGTSDIHSHALNWDYYKDAVYNDFNPKFPDTPSNAVGLARVSSVVNQIRADRGRDRTLLFDAGDTIQGTPLGFYYATVEPITTTGAIHPMAAQMNAIGYDAVALGNHEFNYGLEFLDKWISQMDADVLGANAVRAGTTVPAYKPYTIKTIKLQGRQPIRVGVLGMTNPGVVIWDKANVSGKVEVLDIIETAKRWVPIIRREGVDILMVSVHSGDSGTSSYGNDLPNENAALLLAQQVPGIDAILYGHAHVERKRWWPDDLSIPAAQRVAMSEPVCWGERLSIFDFDLEFVHGRWVIADKRINVMNTNTVADDPALVSIVQAQHDAVVAYVNKPVATSTEAMSAAAACWTDTAILDYINKVQTDTVAKAIAGTPEASLPIVSIAAPFSRAALFPAGQVTIRDIAGLYIYDNTLMASVLTGAEIKDYLEYSAKYYNQVPVGTAVDTSKLTNAVWPVGSTSTVPDYNYDQFSGVVYDVDVAQPVGSRILNLSWQGAPVDPNQKFVVAINNYRQSGGGGFPHIATAPVIYNAQVAIREAIVAYATAAGVIDPKDFHVVNWRLVQGGVPVF
ncbi:bifunctional metallophosphatase/5'-nucleotidase [Microbacterium sp. ASV49]|uniref:5'-nucleotidase C-terminal domain-containing protein n=1 Tax=Microbacterium candidum TaxID=3041922 RepID=A0ABT7N085_9MICO|nr:5'-nucleotidase C-terminal domain-containing protein [Microbacterium sp. ASV49]MDL9980121.1 5'-nucleotidase C-terminal domain-containing protein [Microbacterium sp. ASV49]